MEKEIKSLRKEAYEQSMIAQHARKCLREEKEKIRVGSFLGMLPIYLDQYHALADSIPESVTDGNQNEVFGGRAWGGTIGKPYTEEVAGGQADTAGTPSPGSPQC